MSPDPPKRERTLRKGSPKSLQKISCSCLLPFLRILLWKTSLKKEEEKEEKNRQTLYVFQLSYIHPLYSEHHSYREETILDAWQMEYTTLVYYSGVLAGRFCHGLVDFNINRPGWLVVKKVSFNPCTLHEDFFSHQVSGGQIWGQWDLMTSDL